MIIIKVPCSSANIGPGFDVIGLALDIYLELHVTTTTITPAPTPIPPLNCTITYTGPSPTSIPLHPSKNLITQSALYLLRCHNHTTFPLPTTIHIHNPIPLNRGLGSSGAAVVAGILLANTVAQLNLSKPRLLDYCLMIERHPDNVAAALYGGFVGTYLRDMDAATMARVEIPVSEVLGMEEGGAGAGAGVDTGRRPPEPPAGIGHCVRFGWAPEVKAIAVIPDFEVKTARARAVLPERYLRQDVIFNLQRLALLTTALAQSPPNPTLIHEAMRDKIHQPYRQTLIPGLAEVLAELSPTTHPGLLGVCLSGAGPTILALATGNFEGIAGAIVDVLGGCGGEGGRGVRCEWRVLGVAGGGATVEDLGDVGGWRR